MKKLLYLFTVTVFSLTVLSFSGCSGDNPELKKEIKKEAKPVKENEALIKFLEQSGNFINNHRIPTLISADDVRANLKKFLVIDLRSHNAYVTGHIDGAINVDPKELVSYMKRNVAAGTFDKIVLVCYSGQKASFSAMALQLLGYSNVYAMKWGMSSWDMNTAGSKWLKKVSDKYSNKLEKKDYPKHPKSNLPEIKTGKVLGYDILEERAKEVLGKMKFTIGIDEVMKNPSDYYIINYWPVYNYQKGHLSGAVQYTPKQSLTIDKELLTLPTDKKIVVYCYTGQHAAFVAAYLQILGYDAYSISYGANSFMHSKLSSLKIGHAFTRKEVKNYPLIQGELPSLKKEGQSAVEEEEAAPAPIIRKKAVKEEEGGC